MNFLNTTDFTIMQKSLDALWTRQRVISDNIANMDTPGYKAKYVEFESILRQRLDGIRSGKISADDLRAGIHTDFYTTARVDGNNVDIDKEGVELARTKIQYDFMTSMISSEFARLRSAIREGR